MTLVKRENLYKYLVMIVHPDRNPNDPLATKKTQDVNFNKSNPDVLIALAKVWGLPIAIEGESPYTSTPDPRNTNTNNTRNPFQGRSNTGRSNFDNFQDLFNQNFRNSSTNGFKPSIQDIIYIRSLGKCYIISVNPITSGKYVGGTKYGMFSTLKNKFYEYKTTSGRIAGVEKKEGSISKEELKRLSETFLETFGRRIDKNNVQPSDIHTQFMKVGLEQNRFYGSSKKVKIVGWSGIYDVIKTTDKCVYVNIGGKITRKSIDKIRMV